MEKRSAPSFGPSLLRLGAALAAVLAFASCSQAAPRIASVSARIVYRAAPSGQVERLSLFVLGADDDGAADLEELHLLNDEQQLHWKLGSSDWAKAERSGETWVGAHSLAMPDGGRFPRGAYRVVLMDKGGEKAERIFSLDQAETPARAFPTLELSGGTYKAVSAYPKNSLVVYDASGGGAKTLALRSLSGSLSELEIPKTAVSLALWAEDESGALGALTEAVALPKP